MKSVAVAACHAVLLLSGCVAPTGPVEVTRFHLPDTAMLAHGGIAVEPAPGMDGSSLEYRSYASAVARQLVLLGYNEQLEGGSSNQIALVRVERTSLLPEHRPSPVSVGVGGGADNYGSGVGIGIGFDLSGPPPEQVDTRLSVAIKDRTSGGTLWEGRASFTVRASSPLADTQLGAAKLAEALFKNFPGQSGETVRVK